jgi:hypothetical protein
MAKYFTIMHGLRGCYMPDGEPYVVMVKTRRELKEAIKSEADMVDSGATIGLSKRAIAQFAAICWRESHKKNPAYLPYCLPTKEPEQTSYSYGIFCSVASRHEFLEHEKQQESFC